MEKTAFQEAFTKLRLTVVGGGLLFSACSAQLPEAEGREKQTQEPRINNLPRVFCIHGFLRGAACHARMVKHFHENRYRAENWCYPSRAQGIEAHAAILVESLRQEAKARPGHPMHFVTHSLGGLVLRAALNHEDCPVEAREGHAVLIAPPNQGAALGHFLGKSDALRWFAGEGAGQELLNMKAADVQALGAFPESMKVLVIAGTCGFNPVIDGPDDGKVGVAETRLESHHEHITFFAGHSWLTWDRQVMDCTHTFIKRGTLR